MNNQEILDKTVEHVKQTLKGQEASHDWWHIERVWVMAKRLALEEHADLFVVELAALLHDIADAKFHNGDGTVGPRVTQEWLEKLQLQKKIVESVVSIVANQSYSSSLEQKKELSLEGKVVQDADRLDALGAIGIARTMAYCGGRGHPIYDPTDPPKQFSSTQAYRKAKSSSINHFYEKLLLLKDKMNTKTAKQIAKHRHEYMEQYLQEFYSEWDGKQ